MTTTLTVKRRRNLTGDVVNESDDDQGETCGQNPQNLTKRRVSATGDFASHRLIVSERQQLAVLKQLTATDETTNSSTVSSTNRSQQRSTKIFRRNEHGETIVHIAARKGDVKQLKKALKEGANVNEEDNAGWTPLHEAVTKNQYRAASLLLKSGANANALGPEGQTPLIDAVLNNNIKIVHLLLNYSADSSVVDLTRINNDMIQILKREQTIVELSENENDDDLSDSLSSSINSSDEFEQDEKNLSESSITNRYDEFKVDTNISKRNPYDFESEDEQETSQNQDPKLDDSSLDDNYRVPPLRIVLARTILTANGDSNMDESLTQESSSLPIIEDNDKLLSTVTTLSDNNNNDDDVISNLLGSLLSEIENNLSKEIESKPLTRTLRSHVKNRVNTNSNSHSIERSHRALSRKRTLEKKYSFDFTERPIRRKKTISERSNTNVDTSSNSDDQDRVCSTEDGEIEENHSKSLSTHSEYESLPPNKRRLRERNHGLINPIEENLPIREIPINGIKQFMKIRQQVEKRHETMLNGFVMPKVPKDFSETLMAKKNYLLTPMNRSIASVTPASLGIKRLNPPSDLDIHLTDVFNRQEDERYRMKLRHQVEREKLILSHEQEILRLYGNATRSSINQDIPLSYCSILKDNEVYTNITNQQNSSIFLNNDNSNKTTKTPWNEQVFFKLIEESNEKYKRLSCEINQRQYLEVNTLYSMQKMVWLKHIPKDTSLLNRMNSLLSERYLPKVEINTNFWTQWQINSF